MTTESLFAAAADGLWRPSELARSPWDPAALHGGPVAALVARAAEAVDAPGPMEPARLTLELLKPVPVAPLSIDAGVVRAGRMVQLVEVELRAGETMVARGRVLRLRRDRDATATFAEQTASPPPPPPASVADHGPTRYFNDPEQEWVAFHNAGVEHRFVSGAFDELGPSIDWIRLRIPVVVGEPPSWFQRVVAAADFANGISAAVPMQQATFVNPDLTVHVARPMEGEWVGLDSRTTVGPHGIAMSHSRLYDHRGLIGSGAQSLLIQSR